MGKKQKKKAACRHCRHKLVLGAAGEEKNQTQTQKNPLPTTPVCTVRCVPVFGCPGRDRLCPPSPRGPSSASVPLPELVSPAGPCHPECGDQGCDGPSADQCLNCIHYSLGSVKSGR